MAEVVPEAQGNPGQVDAAAPAAAVGHLLVPVRSRSVGHGRSLPSGCWPRSSDTAPRREKNAGRPRMQVVMGHGSLGLGSVLARGIGHVADYLAAAAVIGIGAWMLLAGDKDDDEKSSRIADSR